MEDFILTPLPVRELKSLIDDSVTKAIQNLSSKNEKQLENEELLRIDDVCAILQVSEVTIHTWKRKGLIPFHRISNRIYFKKEEVLQALKKSNSRFIPSAGGEK